MVKHMAVATLILSGIAIGLYVYTEAEINPKTKEGSLVNCFVKGKHIQATEKDCLDLSKESAKNTVINNVKESEPKNSGINKGTTIEPTTSKYVWIKDFVGQDIQCKETQIALIAEKGAQLKSLKERIDKDNKEMENCLEDWKDSCEDILEDSDRLKEDYYSYQGKVSEYENLLTTYCKL